MFGLLVQSSVSNILSNTSLIFQLKVTLPMLSCFSWTQGSEASFHLLIPPTTKETAFCSLIQNIYIFWYKRKTKIVIFYPLTGTVTEFYVWLLHESCISLCDRLVISDGIYFLLLNGFSQSSSVQSLSCVWLFATLWIAACQASLSITNSRSLLKLMPIESVMPSSHLILRRPLLLLPPIPPSIRVFFNESALRMRWPKCWSFSFSISPSNEHPGLICFRMDWLDLLSV